MPATKDDAANPASPAKGSCLPPALYLVATPIGNLRDITLRALAVLQAADVVACEDTRRARQLSAHFGLRGQKFFSLGQHNESRASMKVLQLLRTGKSVALISDGGTPLISDPGYPLVAAALREGLPVLPIPGVSAVTTAICAAGLPASGFSFLGFPPRKAGRRRTFLLELAARKETLIFFESPRRLPELLQACVAAFGATRRACVARELTKLHEEFRRGTLQELFDHYREQPPRGECVLLVAPAAAEED